MRKMHDKCLAGLIKSHRDSKWWKFNTSKSMKGVHSYDILANPHHTYEM